MRFTLKQLLMVVLGVSVCMAACVLYSKLRQRAIVEDVYGSNEIYQLLRMSPHFELFRVNKQETVNSIDWEIPSDRWIVPAGTMSDRSTERLRHLLTEPQNFIVPFVKDWVFSPTVRLRAQSDGNRLDVYFCFTSKEAAIVQNGKMVDWLSTDHISNELSELLSSELRD